MMVRGVGLVAIVLSCVGMAHAVESVELPLVTAEWPPYTSSTLEGNGFVVEFVAAVVEEMGMTPVFKFYPWPRAQKVIESGMVFGGFPFGITKERMKSFDYSDMFLETNTKFFFDKNRLVNLSGTEGLDELKSYAVGVISKSRTFAQLEEAGFSNIYKVGTVEQAIKMLDMGRIQLAALVEHTGWYNIEKIFPDDVNRWGVVQFYKMEAALLISRRYPGSAALRKRFNRALVVVRGRGIYDKLLRKYGLPVR